MPSPQPGIQNTAPDQFLHELREACLSRVGIDVRFLTGAPSLRRATARLGARAATERLTVLPRVGRAAQPDPAAAVTRILVPPALAASAFSDRLRARCGRDAQVRVSARARRHLTIVDRSVAVVDLGLPGPDEPEGVLVHNADLLRILVAHFDQLWRAAAPLQGGGPITLDRFTARQRRILELLAEGGTDDTVGRELGLSERSVRAEVAAIRQLLGARSRFEAGVKYAALRAE